MGNSMKMSTMGQISKIEVAANLLFPTVHNYHFVGQYSDVFLSFFGSKMMILNEAKFSKI